MVMYVLLCIMFTVYYFYFFMCLLVPRRKSIPEFYHRYYFQYYIIIPCLNEETVISKTVRSIPKRANVTIVVVDDGSDDSTADVAFAEGAVVLRRTYPDCRKGKGEALNYALNEIRQMASSYSDDRVIIGVFDADGSPSPDMFSEVDYTMSDSQYGAFQSKVLIRNNQSKLGEFQNVEFGKHVNYMQSLRQLFGGVILGGNGQFIRLSALNQIGARPWNDCLTEDLDIGIRLLLQGWKVDYSTNSYVTQQGLEDIQRFYKQRTRWAQGNFQCVKYVPDVVRSNLPTANKLELAFTLLQPVSLLVAPPLYVALILMNLPALDALGVAFALILALTPTAIITRLAGVSPRVILTSIAYGWVVTAANINAIIRQIKGVRSWTKTERVTE